MKSATALSGQLRFIRQPVCDDDDAILLAIVGKLEDNFYIVLDARGTTSNNVTDSYLSMWQDSSWSPE